MATFELYRRSTVGMCLTETLDQMVSGGVLSPELAIQVLIQFDKSMTDALENDVKSKVSIKKQFTMLLQTRLSLLSQCIDLELSPVEVVLRESGHLHTYRFCDNVWTFILQNAQIKSEEGQETVESIKIVACDSKLLTQ